MLKNFSLVLIAILFSILSYSQVCNNWLHTPAAGSHVSVGDLDVSGTQITVEAMINRTQPYTGGNLWAGDVVSKHVNPTDANYLLRPNSAEITTTNGYFVTPDICEISLNKTYHIAMVYDGSSLKFYRNGFLMSQVAASGNLYQNDFETWIGYYNAQLHNTSFIGYINDVRIWNVARSQVQIRSTMNIPLASPTTIPGLVGYYTFNNLVNKQGNASFNGVLGGAAAINTTNPTCAAFVADSCITVCSIDEDFNFKLNVCAPLTADFKSTSSTHTAIKWQFGDGSEIIGLNSVTHTYAISGNYDVNMILTVGGCTDTITKRILVDVQHQDILLTPDTTICVGATKVLRTSPALSFCWFPTTYLNDPLSPNPTTNTPIDITYFYTAEVVGANLINNGNFSAGNTGFSSDYLFKANNTTEGEYFVSSNPKSWNVAMSACGDHTTGTGNMMMINGSPAPDVKVWTQTITVTPNTNYAFSTWIQALWDPNPARLSFSINGNDIGSSITASLPTCTWTQFYTTWNSGNTTSATISIINKNTLVQGNDFALDDISFAPVFIKRDSVKISVEKPVVRTSKDTSICFGGLVQLTSSGANAYSWSPANNLSNPNIGNPIAQPQISNRYIVTGTTQFGCQAKDTVDIAVFTKNAISASNDTLICANNSIQLNASGGVSYKWSPASTLNNSSIDNPIATPSQTTNYVVEMVDINSCIFKDTIQVALKTYPDFKISGDTSICVGTNLRLNASGGDTYQWSPSGSLDNPQSASPTATPLTTSSYTVYVKDNLCFYDTTMSVNITLASSPIINATKLADIDCQNPTTQLMATGAVSYSWAPSYALDDARKQNPVVTIDSTTTFVLTGKDKNGCSGNDTVTVSVSKAGAPLFVLPNAFTPNNDGKNDCFGIKRWGNVEIIQLAVFNRWGQIVFETKDPKKCWDGRFKGQLQPSGGYVYIIKAKSFCGEIFRKGNLMLLN
jgi:gliding motility-associated-like protein